MGVSYIHLPIDNIEDAMKAEEFYLYDYETSPFKTDLKYFLMLSYRIIFQGLRSR